MQATSVVLKGSISVGCGYDVKSRSSSRVLGGGGGLGELRKRNLSLQMSGESRRGRSCFGLSLDSVSMGIEMGRVRTGVDSVFRSSANTRSIKAQAAAGTLLYYSLSLSPFSFFYKCYCVL